MANKNKNRDTVTYALKDGNKTVYIGQTNDLERREKEHQAEGKDFTKIAKTSRKMTQEGALKKEKEALARYRKNQGENPKYNETDEG